MLLQKYHLNSLLILVLISLNVALCIRLYNQKSLLSNINDRLFEAEKYSEYYLASIEKNCKTSIDFSAAEIQHFLTGLNCRELLEENSFYDESYTINGKITFNLVEVCNPHKFNIR